MIRLFLNRSLFFAAFLFCFFNPFFFNISESSEKSECIVRFINSDKVIITLKAEIARTDATRSKGLMFRKKLPVDSGMVFIFPRDQYMNFWMQNTYIPLSIAYVDSSGTINEIYHMKPLDSSITYPSALPARYAIEVNRGWFHVNKITTGCPVLLNGCLGK